MVANFLIGLREGLEASLVVGILVAYLVRTGRRDRLWTVSVGVGVAVALSLAVGAGLTFTSAHLGFKAQEALGGGLSIVAVGFVTWMVFWMRRTARFLRRDLDAKMSQAVAMGTTALVLTSFLAVGREGLETTLFVWSAVKSSGSFGVAPLGGALLGIAVAVVIGYLVYRQSVRINLATFFRWTGAALVVVAAGVLAYGVHDLQEAGILPGLDRLAFDVSSVIAPTSVAGTLIKGVFNLSPAMTVLEVVVWAAYLIPVMIAFLMPARRPSTTGPATAAAQPQGQATPAQAAAGAVQG
ncbi:MAG: iron uptake transporter permease EfeU [Kineosporiaceae bacterium]